MNGNWKEADDLAVSLPEDDPEVFSIYAKLLYVSPLGLILRTPLMVDRLASCRSRR